MEDNKCVLIDMAKLRVVKVCPTVRQCEYWAEILLPKQDFRIQGPENRHWSYFTMMELTDMYMQFRGFVSTRFDSVQDAMRGVRAMVDKMQVDDTQEDVLVEKLGRTLPPTIQAPANNQGTSNNPGDYSGNVASPAGMQSYLTSNETEMDMATKKAASKKAPAKKATAKKVLAPKAVKKKVAAPKAPKADRVEQNGIVRPKPGGKCAAIWDIADKISSKKRKPATAAEVYEKGVADGLNESNCRVEYQRWKKFNGIEGRVTE